MGLIINYTNQAVLISGDAHLAEKLPEDFNANEVDLTGERINADLLAVAYNEAESKGIEAIKRYFAIKEKFIGRMELQKPVVESEPEEIDAVEVEEIDE